jgi:hypothetical protein
MCHTSGGTEDVPLLSSAAYFLDIRVRESTPSRTRTRARTVAAARAGTSQHVKQPDPLLWSIPANDSV